MRSTCRAMSSLCKTIHPEIDCLDVVVLAEQSLELGRISPFGFDAIPVSQTIADDHDAKESQVLRRERPVFATEVTLVVNMQRALPAESVVGSWDRDPRPLENSSGIVTSRRLSCIRTTKSAGSVICAFPLRTIRGRALVGHPCHP